MIFHSYVSHYQRVSPVFKTLQVMDQESPPITEVICAGAIHAVCAELSLAVQDVG